MADYNKNLANAFLASKGMQNLYNTIALMPVRVALAKQQAALRGAQMHNYEAKAENERLKADRARYMNDLMYEMNVRDDSGAVVPHMVSGVNAALDGKKFFGPSNIDGSNMNFYDGSNVIADSQARQAFINEIASKINKNNAAAANSYSHARSAGLRLQDVINPDGSTTVNVVDLGNRTARPVLNASKEEVVPYKRPTSNNSYTPGGPNSLPPRPVATPPARPAATQGMFGAEGDRIAEAYRTGQITRQQARQQLEALKAQRR